MSYLYSGIVFIEETREIIHVTLPKNLSQQVLLSHASLCVHVGGGRRREGEKEGEGGGREREREEREERKKRGRGKEEQKERERGTCQARRACIPLLFVNVRGVLSGFSPENLRGGKNCSSISKIYEYFMKFVLFSTGKLASVVVILE